MKTFNLKECEEIVSKWSPEKIERIKEELNNKLKNSENPEELLSQWIDEVYGGNEENVG